jgi:CheY-like chemotaxis protein
MQANGGCLDIGLTDITIDHTEHRRRYPDAKPGDYIRLSVSDQGHGIDDHILHRIFDPFFTTKEMGEGTGMGLSVVHGIVKSYGGFIYAHSRLGEGSTFEILIPAKRYAPRPETIQDEPIPTGNESILFVDDETMIVDVVKRMLESLGYRVVARTSAIEALEAFKANPEGFDLLVTDMVMPKMSGLDLVERIHRIRPGFPAVLCTGFNANLNEKSMAEHGFGDIIHKPILRRDMATAVRRTLDRRGSMGDAKDNE